MPLGKLLSRSKIQDGVRHSPLEYKPLAGPHEFRVLQVVHVGAGKDATNMPLLSIKHVSMSSLPSYAAISYMWSSSKVMEDVTIDGRILQVRVGIKSMISDLSDMNQSCFLWIDAVCINQKDIEERHAQVKIMGDIYSQANYVIAYLRGSDHSNYRSAYLSGQPQSHLSLYSTVASIKNAVEARDPEALTKELDYARFFDNNYFNRQWIVPEICLARSVIIRCDGFELSMGLLERYFTLCGQEHKYAVSRAANICTLRTRLSAGPLRLEDLLYSTKTFVCSERFDKVYALRSMSEAGTRHIPVDYNMSSLSLMVSVLHTAIVYQRLSSSKVLGLACLLRKSLKIALNDIEQGIRDPGHLGERFTNYTFYSRVHVRGILRDRRVDADSEDCIIRLRPHLPSLRHYKPVEVTQYSASDSTRALAQDLYSFPAEGFMEGTNASRGTRTNASDLWAFSSTSQEAAVPMYSEEPESRPCEEASRKREIGAAGLSSASIDVGDEVWHFPRTPVALIARRGKTSYTIVARALTVDVEAWKLRDTQALSRSSRARSAKLENIVDWFEDENIETDSSNTKTIALGASSLLGLMKWVDTFADY